MSSLRPRGFKRNWCMTTGESLTTRDTGPGRMLINLRDTKISEKLSFEHTQTHLNSVDMGHCLGEYVQDEIGNKFK
eukprot:13016727-Heterocapsa_arctica.AAC.1